MHASRNSSQHGREYDIATPYSSPQLRARQTSTKVAAKRAGQGPRRREVQGLRNQEVRSNTPTGVHQNNCRGGEELAKAGSPVRAKIRRQCRTRDSGKCRACDSRKYGACESRKYRWTREAEGMGLAKVGLQESTGPARAGSRIIRGRQTCAREAARGAAAGMQVETAGRNRRVTRREGDRRRS
jgi:hypothetical protein